MDRRRFLKYTAVGAIGGIAGCSEVQDQITGGLEVRNTDAESTAFGNVRVGAVVENTASSSKSGTLVFQVDIQNGDTYSTRRRITLPGGESNTYTETVDLSLSRSLQGGQYQYQVFLE